MSGMQRTRALWRDQNGVCHPWLLDWAMIDGQPCEDANADEPLVHAGETETAGWAWLKPGAAQVYGRPGRYGDYLVGEELVS